MRKFEEIYVAIWCVVMPITGTVLLPGVQGTIPAYMLALGSAFLVYMKVQSGEVPAAALSYFKTALYVALLWLFLLAMSQMGLIISDRHDFGTINMVDKTDSSILLRRTLFTQSLYFLACVLIALYFCNFFKERWMRYVYWGGYFLAGYGIYEWLFFLVFHHTGDFLGNRTFGDHPGSWSQLTSFGGVQMLRIKSTLGEPTFFAAVVIPYLFIALDGKKWVLSAMLLFTAIFSTSTACYVCLLAMLFVKCFWTRRVRWDFISLLVFMGLVVLALALVFPENFRAMFLDKFNGDNNSGAMRKASHLDVVDMYSTFTIPNWLFGIGFGYVYLGVYDALLINTGIMGLSAFLWVFGRAAWLLPVVEGYEGLKAALLSIMILCGLSLSELYLPTTWMFIGLAYYKLEKYRQEQYFGSMGPTEGPELGFGVRSHFGGVAVGGNQVGREETDKTPH